jgi:hypothetical protein
MVDTKDVAKRWRTHALVVAVWAIACWGTAWASVSLIGRPSDCSAAATTRLGSVVVGIVTVPLLVCLLAIGYSKRTIATAVLGFFAAIAGFSIPTIGGIAAITLSFAACRLMLIWKARPQT